MAARTFSYTLDGAIVSLTPEALKQVVIHRRDTVSAARRERRRLASIMHSDRVQAYLNKAIQRQLDKAEKRTPPPKIRVLVEPRNRRRLDRSSPKMLSKSRIPLPKYEGPIVDAQGRRGIVMIIDYDGAKKHAFGIMRRRVIYISNPEHCESDAHGNAVFFSNMGADLDEILMGADLAELAQRKSRADAKLNVNIIIQMPFDVSQETRAVMLKAVSYELFGRHGLPYAAALHEPDPDGDPRNFHGHICGSWRPITRTTPYRWEVAQDFRSDLDGAPYWQHARRRVAEIMTAMVQREGLDRQYTHLSNAERGLVHKPQKKLDKRKTRAARAGEFVADVEANRALIESNVALAKKLAEKKGLRHKHALKRTLALLAKVESRHSQAIDLSAVTYESDMPASVFVSPVGFIYDGAKPFVHSVETPCANTLPRSVIDPLVTGRASVLSSLRSVPKSAFSPPAGLADRVAVGQLERDWAVRQQIPRTVAAPSEFRPGVVLLRRHALGDLASVPTSTDRHAETLRAKPVSLPPATPNLKEVPETRPAPAELATAQRKAQVPALGKTFIRNIPSGLAVVTALPVNPVAPAPVAPLRLPKTIKVNEVALQEGGRPLFSRITKLSLGAAMSGGPEAASRLGVVAPVAMQVRARTRAWHGAAKPVPMGEHLALDPSLIQMLRRIKEKLNVAVRSGRAKMEAVARADLDAAAAPQGNVRREEETARPAHNSKIASREPHVDQATKHEGRSKTSDPKKGAPDLASARQVRSARAAQAAELTHPFARKLLEDKVRREQRVAELHASSISYWQYRNDTQRRMADEGYKITRPEVEAQEILDRVPVHELHLPSSIGSIGGLAYVDDETLMKAFGDRRHLLALPEVKARLQAMALIQQKQREWLCAAIVSGRVTVTRTGLQVSRPGDKWAHRVFCGQQSDPKFQYMLWQARVDPETARTFDYTRPEVAAWKEIGGLGAHPNPAASLIADELYLRTDGKERDGLFAQLPREEARALRATPGHFQRHYDASGAPTTNSEEDVAARVEHTRGRRRAWERDGSPDRD